MYFKNVTTINELKKQFRKLAFKLHPDCGGNADEFKAMNQEYEILFKQLQAAAPEGSFDKKEKLDDGFREALERIQNLEGIIVEICGRWMWVSGDTYANRKALSDAGFYFAGKKKMWYWRPDDAKVVSTGMKDMQYIRSMYGSKVLYDSSDKRDDKRPKKKEIAARA